VASIDPAQIAVLLAAVLAAGLFAGLIAGLFGVGGGTVVVPALFYVFATLKLGGESNLHVAVGSSLAVIIATSARSIAAHRTHGAVDEAVLKTWTPWVAVGALLGAAVAGVSSKGALSLVYAAAVTIVAVQMGFGRQSWRLGADLPEGWLRRFLGGVIGLLSAMMGVGGGAMGSMLMTLYGRPIHQAVATAAGFGLAIGIPAALGFIVFGWDAPGRPPLSLGYVNVPAAVLMGLVTTVTAPFGAPPGPPTGSRCPEAAVRRCFCC
jgi:uncharacterized membrane protein YfcA